MHFLTYNDIYRPDMIIEIEVYWKTIKKALTFVFNLYIAEKKLNENALTFFTTYLKLFFFEFHCLIFFVWSGKKIENLKRPMKVITANPKTALLPKLFTINWITKTAWSIYKTANRRNFYDPFLCHLLLDLYILFETLYCWTECRA